MTRLVWRAPAFLVCLPFLSLSSEANGWFPGRNSSEFRPKTLTLSKVKHIARPACRPALKPEVHCFTRCHKQLPLGAPSANRPTAAAGATSLKTSRRPTRQNSPLFAEIRATRLFGNSHGASGNTNRLGSSIAGGNQAQNQATMASRRQDAWEARLKEKAFLTAMTEPMEFGRGDGICGVRLVDRTEIRTASVWCRDSTGRFLPVMSQKRHIVTVVLV